MKKVVVKCTIHDDKSKQKAMKAISSLTGIDSISADSKDGKLTIIGDVDPVVLVGKLRAKKWSADIVSVGPAKEEKKEEKKPEEKKPEEKKPEEKKEDAKKKEEDKKKEMEKQLADLVKAYQNFNPHMTTQYYVQSVDDNPNGCVIL